MAQKNITQLGRRALIRRSRALLRARPPADPSDPLSSLTDAERHELEEIHAALERVERGIYGRCEDCGAKIAAVRLEAVPHERLCASCDAASLGSARA